MAFALLLVLIVIAELAISVWLLARHREYLRRIHELEMNFAQLEGWVTESLTKHE